MSEKRLDIEIGGAYYLREDYEEKNVSEEFNIPCKVIEVNYSKIQLKTSNAEGYTGRIIKVKRPDRDQADWVAIDSLKK